MIFLTPFFTRFFVASFTQRRNSAFNNFFMAASSGMMERVRAGRLQAEMAGANLPPVRGHEDRRAFCVRPDGAYWLQARESNPPARGYEPRMGTGPPDVEKKWD